MTPTLILAALAWLGFMAWRNRPEPRNHRDES